MGGGDYRSPVSLPHTLNRIAPLYSPIWPPVNLPSPFTLAEPTRRLGGDHVTNQIPIVSNYEVYIYGLSKHTNSQSPTLIRSSSLIFFGTPIFKESQKGRGCMNIPEWRKLAFTKGGGHAMRVCVGVCVTGKRGGLTDLSSVATPVPSRSHQTCRRGEGGGLSKPQ